MNILEIYNRINLYCDEIFPLSQIERSIFIGEFIKKVKNDYQSILDNEKDINTINNIIDNNFIPNNLKRIGEDTVSLYKKEISTEIANHNNLGIIKSIIINIISPVIGWILGYLLLRLLVWITKNPYIVDLIDNLNIK